MSEECEKKFPSVNLAYDIAVDSFDFLAKRLDAIDGRLQTIVAIFTSVTVTVAVIAARLNLSFHSKWFNAGVALMSGATILATVARLVGGFKLLDPSKFDTDEWLQKSEWEFRNLVIQYAGRAFTANRKRIFWKWLAAVLVTFIFFLGALCLMRWIVWTTTNP